MEYLNEELPKYGKNVQLVYGGVMPNPTVEKLYDGIRIARDNQVDFILAAMGKSTDWMVHMLGQAVGAHTDATIRTDFTVS